MRLVAAAALYFVCVFVAAWLFGTVRVFVLEPQFGVHVATFIEAPCLLSVMYFAAPFAARRAGLAARTPLLLGMGALALVLQQTSELVLSFALRGMSLEDQVAHLQTPQGRVYLALLAAYLLMPWLRRGAI